MLTGMANDGICLFGPFLSSSFRTGTVMSVASVAGELFPNDKETRETETINKIKIRLIISS